MTHMVSGNRTSVRLSELAWANERDIQNFCSEPIEFPNRPGLQAQIALSARNAKPSTIRGQRLCGVSGMMDGNEERGEQNISGADEFDGAFHDFGRRVLAGPLGTTGSASADSAGAG